MSYLGVPRLHFAGRIQTDVATVNNLSAYYDNDQFEPRFQRVSNLPDQYNGLWNPRGTEAFRPRGCRVTGITDQNGVFATAGDDPVFGAYVLDDDRQPSGKLIDLDPHNQSVPVIYGLVLRLADTDGAELLRGSFTPAALDDFWIRYRVPGGRGDAGAGYQSVLTDLSWPGADRSPFLRALREATEENRLSIKLNLDGFETDPAKTDTVGFGRVTATIGVHRAGEPRHFVLARKMRVPPGGLWNQGACEVDERAATVTIDLGNSIPTTSLGGPLITLGPLRLAVFGEDGQATVLAPLNGLEGDFYRERAALVTATLTAEQLTAVATGRLAVVDATPTPNQILAENDDASFLRADWRVFRLYPGTDDNRATTTFHATRFGRPAEGYSILVGGGQKPPPLDFPTRLTTGPDGRAEFWITSGEVGNPRRFIDGAVFAAPYGPADGRHAHEGLIAVRVFDAYSIPDRPTWVRDVQPIFQQYANLYPSMRDVFDMANYRHVVRHSSVIKTALGLPPESPHHMPATRDLSPRKRDMIVKWLDTAPTPPVLEIDTIADLHAALQQALLLEHAVIPTYLATLMSIKAGHNTEIADTISQVVREEMLHMALVGNLLNAVGAKPRIGRPALVPTYPGRLPAPVLPDLTVRLRRMSIEHVRQVFMAIERPEHPMVDGERFTGRVFSADSVKVDSAGVLRSADSAAMDTLESWFGRAEYPPMTIGWFYNQLAKAIIRLDRKLSREGKTLFTGDRARQVSWSDAPGTLYRVTDRRTALLALYEIVEQGEGTPQDLDNDTDPDKLGHYYRFAEIVAGRRLVRNARGRWVYEGPAVPFDPDGVHPMTDDPDTYRLAAGTVPRRESMLCDEMYTKVLVSLQRVFDGHPGELTDAMALMYSLQIQARRLFELPVTPDAAVVVGPAFQSPGVVLG
ncbi:ferritin-like protein [Nonomuraea endophytica]|uniref:ferritin-like protein n=1 Tax=Nonomuraea endophytica TaxID=714136 RepID=UPI0037C60743